MTEISRMHLLQTTAITPAAPSATLAEENTLPLAPQEAGAIATTVSKAHPYVWHVSFDGGYIYNEPCGSREEAVAIAQNSHGGGIIAECQNQDYSLEIDGYSLLELLEDQNEELIGEGEFFDCTKEQTKELGELVSATIAAWAEKHQIDTTAWQFGDTQNKENILELPENKAKSASLLKSVVTPT